MKNILKIRNFDSLKKLSKSRAIGKQKFINNGILRLNSCILTLNDHNMLTDSYLWDLLEMIRIYRVESAKLGFIILMRHRNSELFEEDIPKYINTIRNCEGRAVNIPYQISAEWHRIIYKREKAINQE